MKIKTSNLKHWLWLVIFLFSLLGVGQNAQAQWWKDTLWTRSTDQKDGFYMLKFSKNDSIIVGHGMQMDLFFDAKTGNEIKRIPGNNEVFFINNDMNFVRLREDNSKFEIFDASNYSVISTIENDEKYVNEYPIIDLSKDEKYLVAGIPRGFRIWDIQKKTIFNTKIFPDEPNLISVGIDNPRFICGTNKVMVQLSKTYQDPNNPNKKYNYGDFVVYDINTLVSVDSYGNHRGFVLSHNCQYIAYGTGDMYNGVEVYDFNTKELLWTIPINGPSLTGLEFSPDDKFLVTANNNNTYGMTIWDMATGQEHFHYISGATYSNIDVSNNGQFITYSIIDGLRLIRTHFNGDSIDDQFNTEEILYPNPTNNTINLTFEVNSPINLNYSLYSDTGQLIKPLLNEFTKQGTVFKTFDISFLLSGNYFIRITGADFGLTFKVIIVK